MRETALPQVLYIAGYGRSGSTILDMLLGTHPDVFSAGELTRVFRAVVLGEPCSCGAPVDRCPLWGAVLAETGVHDDRTIAKRAWQATVALDQASVSGVRRRHHAELYERLWPRLLHILARRTGASVVVDSSKTTRLTRNRPNALRAAGVGVSVVQLTRDPARVIESALRGTNTDLAKGKPTSVGVTTPFRVAVGWIAANEWRWRHGPVHHVRYEALLRAAEAEIPPILARVGLEAAPVLDHLAAGHAMPTGHGIAGNRLRGQGGVRFGRMERPESTGRPWSTRAALMLLQPFSGRWGYGGDGG